MAPSGNINLFKTETTLPPEVQALQGHLRRLALGAVVGVIGIGLVVAIAYAVVQATYSSLSNNKTKLVSQINGLSSREGAFLSVKTRSDVVAKILETQKSWTPLIATVMSVASPPRLGSIALDEKGRANLIVKAPTLEEAATAVSGILNLAQQQVVRNPRLESLLLDIDGTVRLTFSFIPNV